MLKEFCPCNNQTWVLVNGVRQRSGAVQADPGLLGYSLTADEVGKTAEQLFDKSLRKVRQSGEQPTSSLGATRHEHPPGPLIPQGGALVDPRSLRAGSLHQTEHYWPPLPLSWLYPVSGTGSAVSIFSDPRRRCLYRHVQSSCREIVLLGPGSLQRESPASSGFECAV